MGNLLHAKSAIFKFKEDYLFLAQQ